MTSPLDDKNPLPEGELVFRLHPNANDTNSSGDIYAGWLLQQMDSAGAYVAFKHANGRVTTVATSNMVFLRPVPIGSSVTFYAQVIELGRSSIRILVEVWIKSPTILEASKVTEGEFVYVAIDDNGRTRGIGKG